jgi:hypothetical protein
MLIGMQSDPHKPVTFVDDRPFGRLREPAPATLTAEELRRLDAVIKADRAARVEAAPREARNRRKKARQKRASK